MPCSALLLPVLTICPDIRKQLCSPNPLNKKSMQEVYAPGAPSQCTTQTSSLVEKGSDPKWSMDMQHTPLPSPQHPCCPLPKLVSPNHPCLAVYSGKKVCNGSSENYYVPRRTDTIQTSKRCKKAVLGLRKQTKQQGCGATAAHNFVMQAAHNILIYCSLQISEQDCKNETQEATINSFWEEKQPSSFKKHRHACIWIESAHIKTLGCKKRRIILCMTNSCPIGQFKCCSGVPAYPSAQHPTASQGKRAQQLPGPALRPLTELGARLQ